MPVESLTLRSVTSRFAWAASCAMSSRSELAQPEASRFAAEAPERVKVADSTGGGFGLAVAGGGLGLADTVRVLERVGATNRVAPEGSGSSEGTASGEAEGERGPKRDHLSATAPTSALVAP